MPRQRLYYNALQRPTQSWTDVGISLPYGASGELRTDCPQCSHDRHDQNGKSLAVNLEQGIWYCHYCGWKGNLKQPGSAPPLPRPGPRRRSSEEIQRRQMALERVWHEARKVTPADPVARYLGRRGLWQDPVPDVLRYHPHLAYRHEDAHRTYHPALVAKVQAPHGEVATIHRIYLTNAGTKADVPIVKKSMPTPSTVIGAAVRLDTPTETLAVSEGIETALAVRLTAQLPAWSALSAVGMVSIVLPETVRLVVICADHDSNQTGEQAAKKLARRLLTEGRRVKIIMPKAPGTDWADALAEGGQHA